MARQLFLACMFLAVGNLWQGAIAMEPTGVIAGYVRNGTRDQPVGAGTPVVLRVLIEGQLVGGAQTTTDNEGKFRFDGLPLDHDGFYLPGANQGDVHFPGPRLRLSDVESHAHVTLTVYDCSTDVCPLTIARHHVELRAEAGSLHVREVLSISNDSGTCYVGQPVQNRTMQSMEAANKPVTLTLGIPKDFERIVFDEEAFGRRFQVIGDQLITDIPWPPGTRELAFSYVIPAASDNREWVRTIDLPTDEFELSVNGVASEHVHCDLNRVAVDDDSSVRYLAAKNSLTKGHTVQLQIGKLAVPMIVHARRGALGLLVCGVLGTVIVARRRQRPCPQGPHSPRLMRATRLQRNGDGLA